MGPYLVLLWLDERERDREADRRLGPDAHRRLGPDTDRRRGAEADLDRDLERLGNHTKRVMDCENIILDLNSMGDVCLMLKEEGLSLNI